MIKPSLIMINGSLGSGKSTLARIYADNHPLTLRLDIDEVWYMISHWRDYNDASTRLAKDLALGMARVALKNGNDVVVPQIIQTDELAERFRVVAQECAAEYYEVLIMIPKDEAIQRFIERNKSNGHPTGFREGGIIATQGREKKLATMYDNMISVAENRDTTLRIRSIKGDIQGTYKKLINLIERSK